MSKDYECAFPYMPNGDDDQRYHQHGMSLRDWFAGQAVASNLGVQASDYELTAWFGKHRSGITNAEIMAARAYDIADAMLARRKHRKDV